MKAYQLSIIDNDDAGAAIVFADTAKDARAQIYGTTLGDSVEKWIDIRVHRAKEYDGMENLSEAELALKQWHDGWRWYDLDHPEEGEATDKEFLEWYEETF